MSAGPNLRNNYSKGFHSFVRDVADRFKSNNSLHMRFHSLVSSPASESTSDYGTVGEEEGIKFLI